MRYAVTAVLALLLGACGGGTANGDSTAAADAAPPSGEKLYAVCANCHSLDGGSPGRVGPNLHNVMGRKAGSVEGFAYSPALKASELVWDAKTLDAYLANPTAVVPGGRMTLATLDPAHRRALIEYLSTAK